MIGLIGGFTSYEEQIEKLDEQIESLQEKVLRLMELQYADENVNDIAIGDNVLAHDDVYATVIESKFVARMEYGDRWVNHEVTCKTPSGKVGTVYRRELKKI